MSFQKIILIIVTILLIVVLVMFGFAFRDNKKDEKFPPVQGQCPDYWEVKKGKNGIPLCNNAKKLGKSNCQQDMNFSITPFIGSEGRCNKKKWARACDITWDGITNGGEVC